MAPEITPTRYLVQATWDDAPHLDEQTKTDLWASTPPHLRDARAKGIPALGVGAIYPVPLSDIEIEPFEIPAWWPRAYALDVGWNVTAALWGAWDLATDTIYAYAEHYRKEAEPVVHAAAIKARGAWIKGVVDPASRGRSQSDGRQLYATYREHGLHLKPADNAVDAGIHDVWTRLSTGRLKAFTTLKRWRSEYALYHRDEKGRIVKANDHLQDCCRYLVRSGRSVATVQAPKASHGPGAHVALDRKAGY